MTKNISNNEKPNQGLKLLPLISVVLIILLVYLFYGGIIMYNFEEGKRGELGDLFGALNGFFSALAFAGLVYSLWLQRAAIEKQQEAIAIQNHELTQNTEMLALQKEELKLSRIEFQKLAEANSEQVIVQKEQNIFQLQSYRLDTMMKRVEAINLLLATRADSVNYISTERANHLKQQKGDLLKRLDNLAEINVNKIEESFRDE